MTIDAPPIAEPVAQVSGGAGEVPAPARPRRPVPFWLWLVPITLLGGIIRLIYAVFWRFDAGLQYDGPAYQSRAVFLRRGLSFVNTDDWYFHHLASQGAVHPPGNTLLIALGQQLGLRSSHQSQLLGCLIGTITIVVVGYLGKEVGGRVVGIVAATLAAIGPGFWSFDPTVMAETPGQLITAVVLLLAYKFWKTPTLRLAAALGGVTALGALTRSELTILLGILVIPICFTARGTTKQAVSRVAVALLWAGMVLGPWVGWNLVRFEHPVTVASGIDLSIAYAQCDGTWYGPDTGYWNVFCGSEIPRDPKNALADESEIGRQYRAAAGKYIAAHRARWPVVIAARAGRTLSLYPPNQQVNVEHERESRELPVLWGATFVTWLCYLLAIVAFVKPPRSRRHLLPLLMPLAAGVAGAAITFGTSRYRSAGEVGLVVLAGVGVDAILRTWNASASTRQAADGVGTDTDPGSGAAPAPT